MTPKVFEKLGCTPLFQCLLWGAGYKLFSTTSRESHHIILAPGKCSFRARCACTAFSSLFPCLLVTQVCSHLPL